MTILKVIDYQDRGGAGVVPRPVFINSTYVVAMEPWGSKYKAFVGRSLEYVISAEDAALLANSEARSTPLVDDAASSA
jgi:hypothetical protein